MANFVRNIWEFVKRHKIIFSIVGVVVIILAVIFRPKPPAPIATQKVVPGDIVQQISVSGAVAAKNTANLTFPITGIISWIGPKVGDTVNAGQTIATLDTRTALKNLQQALITYSEQRNTFDQTLSNNNNATGPQDAVNDTIKRILQNNQYDLDKSVNSVELSNLAAQQSVLTTPISGIVTKEDATVPGTTEVLGTTTFTVVDPTSTVFQMDVDEADIGKVALGQIADVTLDAYPDETISLPVEFIDFVSHATANGGSAYTVEVKLANTSEYKYRVGMSGNANITTAKKYNVLTIPLSAVVNSNQIYVKKGNQFALRNITLGLQSDTDAEVLSGLSSGDIIATDPTQIVHK